MKEIRFLAAAAAIFNFLGVLPLLGQKGIYRPNRYEEWLSSIAQDPMANTAGGVLFTVGVLAFLFLGIRLSRQPNRFWQGSFIALGGLLNGLTTLFPFVLAYMVPNAAGGALLLAVALLADACYNALLGMGMVLEGLLLKKTGAARLGWSGVVIGCMTIPICFQVLDERAALWLGVAGPAWITWWLIWAAKVPAEQFTPLNEEM